MQLVRIGETLPEGFEVLRREADAEGHRNLARLAAEWAEDPALFTALLGAFAEGRLAAIGGLTREPQPTPQPALRVRRVYVSRDVRGQGVGRQLVSALLQEALDEVALVTVNAHPDSVGLWTAMGFTAAPGQPWSHVFRRDYSAA